MGIRLETVLDECLVALARGEALEACLRRYPKHRAELEPLLNTALAVKGAVRRQAASPETLLRARNRFLAEASAMRPARTPAPHWRLPALLPRTALLRSLATAGFTLVLLAGLLGGGSIVSANTLPGDPLYGVKRASESVRMLLTFNTEGRASLARKLAERRLDEVKQVVQLGREVQVHFDGPVDSVRGDIVYVQGITIQVPPGSSGELLQQLQQPGAVVRVDARTLRDGMVQATSLEVDRVASPAASGPTSIAPAAVVATPSGAPQLRLSATPTTVEPTKPAPTNVPTDTPTTAPSVTVVGTLTAIATPQPSQTPTLLPSATPLPSATATLMPAPRDVEVRIEGRIDEITAQSWTVGGQRVNLHAGTILNQSLARAEVGGWATVVALKRPDGSLLAREIVVLRGAEQPPEPKEFHGTIDSIQPGRWVVAGREVIVTGETVIEGTPRVGAVAYVKAEQHADGRLVAKKITVPAEQIVQFAGLIESISAQRWVVAGQEILIGPDTQIQGQPQVGLVAQVEAVVRADGVKVARRIVVEAPPPTSVPPTAVPAATSTPAPASRTPVPSATAAATAAPTVVPTLAPTSAPTTAPTGAPTIAPTVAPTVAPSTAPTRAPTPRPEKAI